MDIHVWKLKAMIDAGDAICLACGEEMQGYEPDTRNERCPHCEKFRLFGAQELLFVGEEEYNLIMTPGHCVHGRAMECPECDELDNF